MVFTIFYLTGLPLAVPQGKMPRRQAHRHGFAVTRVDLDTAKQCYFTPVGKLARVGAQLQVIQRAHSDSGAGWAARAAVTTVVGRLHSMAIVPPPRLAVLSTLACAVGSSDGESLARASPTDAVRPDCKSCICGVDVATRAPPDGSH